jgi:putative peptide zinc metalloprotease protein
MRSGMTITTYPKAEVSWIKKLDSAEIGNFYVVKSKTDRYIKISENSKRLIELMDGENSLHDIIRKANESYNFNLTLEELTSIIDKFYIPVGIIKGEHSKKSMTSPVWLHIKIMEGRMFKTLSKPFLILFRKDAGMIVAISSILSTAHLFERAGIFHALLTAQPIVADSISIMIIVLFSFLFHEFGHIVSCFHYSIVPGNIGFGMYLFRPVLFTDMSGAWGLRRRQRLVTDLSGIYFQLVLIFFLYFLWILSAITSETASLAILLIYLSIMMSLNPLLRYDGYWILSDLTGIPNAHSKAVLLLKTKIMRLFKSKNDSKITLALPPRTELLFKIYCGFYLGLTSILFGLGLLMFSYFFRDYHILLSMIYGLKTAVLEADIQGFLRNFAGLSIVFIIGCYLSIFGVKAVRSFLDTISKNTPMKERLEVDA